MSGRHRAARRQAPLREHFFWTIAGVALATAALATAFVLRSDSAPRPAAAEPAGCDWDQQLEQTLTDLGEDPAVWTIDDLDTAAGLADMNQGRAWIDRSVPCRMVSSVVRHEAMHLWQGRMHGGHAGAERAYPGEVELVADCASMLLGSTEVPYVERNVAAGGLGCLGDRLAAARELIRFGDATPAPVGATS